ncbi:hypothetical protein D8B23_16765 [Verminephrobacter aporrectodeae subsp. tuberculatae]|uniref:IPT/TIG domain-containing protein n=1 Tax=Verminephrobacter aporrectodeae subsp. tuberculatae TaxID=1110392 RepID=A0ABT3KRX8_9BURK|nr:hypothetical protein [Verminephrobacter aporrectodeae]MCW5321083.1 hypothetical protein [Verminephrobacter aporrectodeae subsp. tuberculatae]MCW8200021.1 hypothetical protein [Verminephrobacter aporrectodeae subsp. tuberculatae]
MRTTAPAHYQETGAAAIGSGKAPGHSGFSPWGVIVRRVVRHVLMLLAPGFVLCAAAQTTVSEPIAANTHWTVANHPYIVRGELALQNGAVLSIDPGVTVYMAPHSGLTVHSGSIRALGTAEKPIRVLSEKHRLDQTPGPGDWKQWIFEAGAVNTRLEHVDFEHGRGLVVHGAAPVFNYLNLRNHLGAAISIDLAASPSGVGLQASGNTLNGIAVPAGEIATSVQWGLRGIPYVLVAGVVSVGTAPAITSVSPSVVEQGQTVALTISGVRLAGLQGVEFDRSGLQATVFPGATDSQAVLQVQVDPAAQPGPAELRFKVDAGEVLRLHAITVTVPTPSIRALDPDTVVAGAGPQAFRVLGRNFSARSEVLVNAAALPTQFVSAGELKASLPNQTTPGTLQVQVRTADPSNPASPLLSAQAALSVQAPVPPTLSVEPTPIALPPDNKAREITLRLSKADYRDNVLNLSVADTTKASVSPASILVAAGQTSVRISVVSKRAGTTTLNVDSPTLAGVRVPMFITADFRGANMAFSAPVGVVVAQSSASVVTKTVSVTHPTVGVAVGAVLTGADPAAWGLASETALTVHGRGIPAGAQIELQPNTGVSVGTASVSTDGTRLTANLQTAADAPLGARKLIVKDAGGRVIDFADPAKSVVSILTGLPTMESMLPFAVLRGGTVELLIRGRHLQQGRVVLVPADGVAVDTQPQASADGTTLTVRLSIASDAPLGPRTVQVLTPAGGTGSVPASTNTLTIASHVQDASRAITSQPVGVRVGADGPAPAATLSRLQTSPLVGLLVGGGVTDVAPRVGVVGTDVEVTLRGVELQGMTAVDFVPAAGLRVLAAPVVDAQGTQARFTLRIDADAARGLRSLVAKAGDQTLGFVRPEQASFLITAPVPELISVSPQVIVAGQAATALHVRGRNFSNITGVRAEPTNGITVTGPFEVGAGGTELGFKVLAATGATAGERTLVVSSAAGDSSTVPAAGNLLRVARQAGPAYADLQSAAVGVVVGAGSGSVGARQERWLSSPMVGLMVGESGRVTGWPSTAASPGVGLLVGAGARSMSPSGWLRGANGNIVIEGQDLGSVTAARVEPNTGLLLGPPVVSADGKQLSVSIAVAPDAPMVERTLRLTRSSSGDLLFTDSTLGRFDIGQMPTLRSLAPIVLEQGKSTPLTIRGSQLQGVTGVVFEPSGGMRAVSAPTWGQDDFGEFLRVTVLVEHDAATGQRVLRLQVPGGMTPASAEVANRLTVVAPQ